MSNIKLLKLIPYKITTEKQHENQNDNSTDNKNMPEKTYSKDRKNCRVLFQNKLNNIKTICKIWKKKKKTCNDIKIQN